MGRSRGGLTTKIHALTGPRGLPIRLKMTEGQAHYDRSAIDMLEDMGDCQTFFAIATRYEKHPENYLALIKLASVRICLRANESVS